MDGAVGVSLRPVPTMTTHATTRAHLDACLAAMAAHDLDALVLGREPDARYVSGAERLWTAGARPFGPGCVVIAATGAVHVQSTWDAGIPAEIASDRLYGLTWNGSILATQLAAVPGLPDARRIGVDGMSPGVARLLAALAPRSAFVDATTVLTALRAAKNTEEVASIRAAVALAASALEAARAHLRPGVRGRVLTGRAAAHLAGLGTTTPDLEASFWPNSPGPSPAGAVPTRPDPTGSPLGDPTLPAGALVAAHVSVIASGYEGIALQTWVNGPAGGGPGRPTPDQLTLGERWRGLFADLTAACVAGRPAGDLEGAYRRAGAPLPAGPVVHGVGLGMEPPLVGAGFPDDAGRTTVLAPGMVLFVLGEVSEPGVGTVVGGETLLVTASGAERLGVLETGLLDPR